MDNTSNIYNERKLSFCIPTFNRVEILTECLTDLIKIIRKYNFEIIISDNNSSDGTQAVVNEFKAKYAPIRYLRQNTSTDPDKNFAAVLSCSISDYTWLIGDSYRIEQNALENLLESVLINEYDLVIVNSFNQVKGIDSKVYTNSSKFLSDLGWYLPIMSAYIYSKDLLQAANYERYFKSNFLQMGITFEYLEKKEFEIYWYAKNGFGATSIPKKSWHFEAFNVFAKNWTEFILALPRTIELPIKLNCIKEHGVNYGVFSFQSLLLLRMNGWLNFSTTKKYKLYFNYVTAPPLIIIVLISVCPKFLIYLFWQVKQILFRN